MKTHPAVRRGLAVLLALTVGFTPCFTTTSALANDRPCRPHGGILATINGILLARYFDWQMGDGADGGRFLKFLPLPEGEETGGSFTYDDPGILTGEAEVTLRPGQSFMVPITAWVGELYEDGSEDQPLAESVLNEGEFRVTINGRTVAHKAAGARSPLYGPATYFDDPILYDEPTDYGSVGALWVQGFSFVHHPLPPGRHVMKLHSQLLIEEYDLGLQFENTWIITVTR